MYQSKLGSVAPALSSFVHTIFDYLLPCSCLICTKPIARVSYLCSTCWSKLTFISPSYSCAACGLPGLAIEEFTLAAKKCYRCADEQPYYDWVASPLVYDSSSKALFYPLKQTRFNVAAQFLTALIEKFSTRLSAPWHEYTVLYIPMYWTSLWKRGFNQAELLAYQLASKYHMPLLNILEKVRHTQKQALLNEADRKINLENAFIIRSRWRASIANRKFILVDDIMTTGATLNNCAKPLKLAGAAEVGVITLARTP